MRTAEARTERLIRPSRSRFAPGAARLPRLRKRPVDAQREKVGGVGFVARFHGLGDANGSADNLEEAGHDVESFLQAQSSSETARARSSLCDGKGYHRFDP